jgi:hypothetical protein
MTITEIIQFGTGASLGVHAPRTTNDNTVQKVIRAMKELVKSPLHLVLGTRIQEVDAIQITLEWKGVQVYVNSDTTPEFNSFIRSVRSFCGEPQSILHTALDRSAFGPDGPATANVVEFAQSYFTASEVAPEFQKQIQEDFLRFNKNFSKSAKGDMGWAFGWVLEA